MDLSEGLRAVFLHVFEAPRAGSGSQMEGLAASLEPKALAEAVRGESRAAAVAYPMVKPPVAVGMPMG